MSSLHDDFVKGVAVAPQIPLKYLHSVSDFSVANLLGSACFTKVGGALARVEQRLSTLLAPLHMHAYRRHKGIRRPKEFTCC